MAMTAQPAFFSGVLFVMQGNPVLDRLALRLRPRRAAAAQLV